ncbi:MAG: phage tail assembly chaperone [Mizugakiibacter sp.]|uniref:phage tail assembly chaperone n=1 Tax=Mizugakiibacter sp. TaxID=1972610 RepID=UPI00320E8ECE
MANKVKLGNRPKNFKRVIAFPLVEGGEGAIEVSFKYRTRSEFGAFIDGIFAAAKEEAPADGEFKMADLMAKTRDKNAAYLLDVIDGWNLDEPLNRETAEQLCDELPAAAAEIMEAYRLCTVEGRVKN